MPIRSPEPLTCDPHMDTPCYVARRCERSWCADGRMLERGTRQGAAAADELPPHLHHQLWYVVDVEVEGSAQGWVLAGLCNMQTRTLSICCIVSGQFASHSNNELGDTHSCILWKRNSRSRRTPRAGHLACLRQRDAVQGTPRCVKMMCSCRFAIHSSQEQL